MNFLIREILVRKVRKVRKRICGLVQKVRPPLRGGFLNLYFPDFSPRTTPGTHGKSPCLQIPTPFRTPPPRSGGDSCTIRSGGRFVRWSAVLTLRRNQNA